MFPFSPKFEVAFDVDPGATPGSADWTDLSDDVESYDITIGRVGAGTLSTVTLDDSDRDYDPTNTASPYNLVPMRHARVTITVSGTEYSVWRGFVDEWPPRWPTYNQAKVELEMTDATAWLALQDSDVDLSAQSTSERVTALLDDSGWPAGLRDISTGVVRVDGFAQEGANLLQVLQDTTDAEDGWLYVDATGQMVFRSRHHKFGGSVDSTARTDGTSLGVSGVLPTFGGTELTNTARVEMADGTVWQITDTTSETAYGPRIWAIRDLPLPWYEAVGIADWDVTRYAQPNFTLSGITFWLPSASEVAEIVQRDIGDLVRFVHTHPGGGADVDATGHLEQVRHHISNDKWETSWDLSPWFGDESWLILDDATKGTLDDGNVVAP